MKILLQRDLYLGGILYKSDPRGTEIPEEIGGKKVVLWTPEYDKAVRQYQKEMQEDGYTEVQIPEDEIVLPRDAKEYSPEEAGKSAPQQSVQQTLSELTKPADRSPPVSENAPVNPNVKTTQKK